MKQLRIKTLSLKNFKGVADFRICPDGHSISICGTNGTGKTTLTDAMSWLLFGKSSTGKADFQIKPVDDSGNEIHNLHTEVIAEVCINNETVELKKTFSEKWITPRGSIKPEFKGNTIEYFLDSENVRKKEYEDFIGSIVEDSIFGLLTNPFGFNNLHWQKRRETLVGICGEIADSDIIDSDRNLVQLPNILGDLSIDKKEKKNSDRAKAISKEINGIPAIIAELTASIQHLAEPDKEAKNLLLNDIRNKREELNALFSASSASDIQVKINNIDLEIIELRKSIPDMSALKRPVLLKIDKLEADRRKIVSKIADIQSTIQTNEKSLNILETAIKDTRAAWYRENSKVFSSELTCQTCGQIIPEDRIRESEERFNVAKSKRLAEIQTEGKHYSADILVVKKEIAGNKATIEDFNREIAMLDSSIAKQIKMLSEINPQIDTSKTDDLQKQKNDLQKHLQDIKAGSREKESSIRTAILEIENKLSVIAVQEAEIRAAQKTKTRIKDLEKKEKALAAEFEKLEQELFLIKKFTIKKIQLLEEKINKKFQIAKFKMFRKVANGDMEECCETLCNGVPYNSGLNNAARINTGLDIINTLSEYYQFSAPVFVDNAESVTELIPMASQLIRLVVDPEYKDLTSQHIKQNKTQAA